MTIVPRVERLKLNSGHYQYGWLEETIAKPLYLFTICLFDKLLR